MLLTFSLKQDRKSDVKSHLFSFSSRFFLIHVHFQTDHQRIHQQHVKRHGFRAGLSHQMGLSRSLGMEREAEIAAAVYLIA